MGAVVPTYHQLEQNKKLQQTQSHKIEGGTSQTLSIKKKFKKRKPKKKTHMHIWPMKKNKILYGLGQTKQKTFESGKNETQEKGPEVQGGGRGRGWGGGLR